MNEGPERERNITAENLAAAMFEIVKLRAELEAAERRHALIQEAQHELIVELREALKDSQSEPIKKVDTDELEPWGMV